MVHPDTDPEALSQDKPALTVLVVMGHFHEFTMNIDFVRYTVFGAFWHCCSFLALVWNILSFQSQQPRSISDKLTEQLAALEAQREFIF